MKNCKKCGNSIGHRVVVNGVRKELKNRLYCLECSPFGARNTRKLEIPKTSHLAREVRCTICGKDYIYDLSHKHGHTMEKCRTCYVNGRRFGLKIRCIEYKGGACKTCGYNKCSRALVFHHRDPTQKELSISSNHCRSWKTLQAELDKCDLLCSNCHAEVHQRLDDSARL